MNIPSKIKDNCPECSVVSYVKTVFTFANEVDQIEVQGDDDTVNEYLYVCDDCSARVWIFEDDIVALEEIVVNVNE